MIIVLTNLKNNSFYSKHTNIIKLSKNHKQNNLFYTNLHISLFLVFKYKTKDNCNKNNNNIVHYIT